MPLDLNQLAPVALWRHASMIDGDTGEVLAYDYIDHPDDDPNFPHLVDAEGRYLTLATYSALVEELRAAREEVARLRAALAMPTGEATNRAYCDRCRIDHPVWVRCLKCHTQRPWRCFGTPITPCVSCGTTPASLLAMVNTTPGCAS